MVMLSASTLGAPGEDLDQMLGALRRTDVDGIELRLSAGELADPAMTRARITGGTSYVRIGSDVPADVVLGALVGALDLAADRGGSASRWRTPGPPWSPGSPRAAAGAGQGRHAPGPRAAAAAGRGQPAP